MAKMKACVASLSSCFGCSVQLFNLKENVMEILSGIDFVNFKLVGREDGEKYDITFIEGAVTTKEEIVKAKKFRENSKIVVALGSCACNGCALTVKNFRKNSENLVYGKNIFGSTSVEPLDKHIKVDFYLRGCPFNGDEAVDFLASMIRGKRWSEKEFSVCDECRKSGTDCLLLKGELCLGPIIRAGCGAICARNGFPCAGCRGLAPDCNLSGFMETALKETGLSRKDIEEKFQLYGLLEKVAEMMKNERNEG